MVLPEGWFFEEDIKAYRYLVSQIPDNGRMIELGVWKGRSLCSVADIIKSKNIRVIAVDTFAGTIGEELEHAEAKEVDLEQVFKDNVKNAGITVTVLKMTTDEAVKKFNKLDKFDLIFIDADHSYAAVKQDIENWLPLCKGIMAGHDRERASVASAVQEVFPDAKGMGLVWWHNFNDTTDVGKKIDIIIPAYKAQNTIMRTLSSIAMQSIVDKCTVTIVNDADGIGYEKFVNQFKDYMDIREIGYDTNMGSGRARQTGIDATKSPYFTCIDADDTFAGAFVLELLLKTAETNPNSSIVAGSFAEQHPNLHFVNHSQDMVWTFGKLYIRSFINKHNIRFNDTRSNEDTGFNTIIKLLSTEDEKMVFLPDIVYYWHHKIDSITRVNNMEYSYNQSFIGYADNMIYAYQCAKREKPFNSNIDFFAISVMAQLYNYYYQTVARDKRFVEQNYNYCIKYYNEIYKTLSLKFTKKQIDDIFAQVLSEQAPTMRDNVPDMTIYQFISQLEKEESGCCTITSTQKR